MNSLLVVSSNDVRREKLCSLFAGRGYTPHGVTEDEVCETLPPTQICIVDASRFSISVLGTLRRALESETQIVLVREDLPEMVADAIQYASGMAEQPLFDRAARLDEPDKLIAIVSEALEVREAA